MKIIVLQSNFARALNNVSKIVGNRATLPVLNNILIEARKNKIKLTTTDLEVGITASVVGKVEEEGSITLPSRLLSDFVLNNKDESIELTLDGTMARLKSERFEANINGISAEEFPNLPESKGDFKIKIPKDKFTSSLKKIIIAPASDETRPVLAGIYFQFSANKLILAATDSYRLAEKRIEIPEQAEEKNIIVPTRTISELFRLLTTSEESDVEVRCADNQITFVVGGSKIVSRLIEGSYPNYEQIIPKEQPIKVIANLNELISSVKLCSLFARESSNNNIKIIISKDGLLVSSITSQVGDTNSSVSAEISGGETEIAFNSRYLLDILGATSAETIKIELKDQNSPALITTIDDPDYLYLVMPLKLD